MRQGWLSNVLNPKAAVLLVTFVPQFVPAGEPAFLRSLAPMATCLRAFGRRLALSRH
jgi:threonine/homoserine/homoserine lactone efflux protein